MSKIKSSCSFTVFLSFASQAKIFDFDTSLHHKNHQNSSETRSCGTAETQSAREKKRAQKMSVRNLVTKDACCYASHIPLSTDKRLYPNCPRLSIAVKVYTMHLINVPFTEQNHFHVVLCEVIERMNLKLGPRKFNSFRFVSLLSSVKKAFNAQSTDSPSKYWFKLANIFVSHSNFVVFIRFAIDLKRRLPLSTHSLTHSQWCIQVYEKHRSAELGILLAISRKNDRAVVGGALRQRHRHAPRRSRNKKKKKKKKTKTKQNKTKNSACVTDVHQVSWSSTSAADNGVILQHGAGHCFLLLPFRLQKRNSKFLSQNCFCVFNCCEGKLYRNASSYLNEAVLCLAHSQQDRCAEKRHSLLEFSFGFIFQATVDKFLQRLTLSGCNTVSCMRVGLHPTKFQDQKCFTFTCSKGTCKQHHNEHGTSQHSDHINSMCFFEHFPWQGTIVIACFPLNIMFSSVYSPNNMSSSLPSLHSVSKESQPLDVPLIPHCRCCKPKGKPGMGKHTA